MYSRMTSCSISVPGDGPARREERELKGPQMAPPMSAQLQWDRKLILDRDSFPNKYAAYTVCVNWIDVAFSIYIYIYITTSKLTVIEYLLRMFLAGQQTLVITEPSTGYNQITGCTCSKPQQTMNKVSRLNTNNEHPNVRQKPIHICRRY